MNRTYDFSSFNTGFSTNTTIGFSENMLDTSGFGRTAAAPLISQANLSQADLSQSVGYSQAYMQGTLTLNERCKALETQLIKVTTEHDTLKMMLEQLSVSLQKLMSPKPSSAEMYPKLHFWTQRQYNEWTNTPKAHEDEQGNTISDRTVKAICKTICSCWAELVVKGMAPRSWGKAKASAKEIVYSLTYKSFPFLQLAESDWKIDLICSLNYPGWIRNNLDDKGNWLASHRVKQEEEATIVDEPGGSTSNPKKCKAKPLKSEAIEKKFKDDLAQENSLVTQATTPDILTGGLSTSEFAGPPLSPVTPSSPVQVPTASLPSASSTTLAERDASATSLLTLPGNVSSSTTVSSPSTFSSASTTPTSDPNIDLPTQALSMIVAEGTMGIPGELTKVSDDADASSTIIVNPLSTFAKKSIILKLPPLPPMPKLVANDKDENNKGNGECAGGTKGKMNSNWKPRMRPIKNKTAYNLCALRWLAQINENGNCNEFHTYWNHQLSEQQREAYKNEAKELVENKAWDNTMSQETLH